MKKRLYKNLSGFNPKGCNTDYGYMSIGIETPDKNSIIHCKLDGKDIFCEIEKHRELLSWNKPCIFTDKRFFNKSLYRSNIAMDFRPMSLDRMLSKIDKFEHQLPKGTILELYNRYYCECENGVRYSYRLKYTTTKNGKLFDGYQKEQPKINCFLSNDVVQYLIDNDFYLQPIDDSYWSNEPYSSIVLNGYGHKIYLEKLDNTVVGDYFDYFDKRSRCDLIMNKMIETTTDVDDLIQKLIQRNNNKND